MQQTAVAHNPFTFYLRTLLYMFVALFLRLVALAPLACLFLFPQGSPLKLLSLLCPAMLALLILLNMDYSLMSVNMALVFLIVYLISLKRKEKLLTEDGKG